MGEGHFASMRIGPSRRERIREGLDSALRRGAVYEWSEEGANRWAVETGSRGQRIFTTAEVEIFLLGVQAGVEASASGSSS
jgi:hypothetical protein